MKKWMKMMAMALMAVAMTVGFVACSSSDDDDNKGGASQQAYGQLKLNITLSEDALSVADFTIKYLDENGQEKSEQITEANFTKTITFKSLPARAKYSITAVVKESLPDKEKFDLIFEDKSSAVKIAGTTDEALAMHAFSKKAVGVKKEKIAESINLFIQNWSNDITINK